MRFLQRGLTGLFILAVTLGLLAYGALMVRGAFEARMAREARVPEFEERVFSVNAVRVNAERITPVITAYGEIGSRSTLEIRPAVGGTITWLAEDFVAGGAFKAGEVMIRIDDADARSALARSEADLSDAQAETRDAARALELARGELATAREQAALRQRAFERQQNLKERGVGTDAAVENAEIAASTARAAVLTRRQALAQAEARVDSSATRLARAKIAVEDATRRLEETEIAARFDGVLASAMAVEGRLVSPNERLGELVDPDDLEVAFRLSTQAYSRLLNEKGELEDAGVTVLLGDFGVDLTAQGRLSREGAAIDSGETGRMLYAELDRAAGFKPGDFVTVKIEEAPLEGVTKLPATALGADMNVLVIDDENRLERAPVTLLRRQGDDVIVRAEELVGKLVVAQRTPLLGPGISVKPITRDAASGAGEVPGEADMIELTEARRAALMAAVKSSSQMPEDVKERLLARLEEPRVPARMVARIEDRMGG
ncbi:HlyD family efflux transporter periplasmic adaptor subunit [Rhodobacteraceae bacterium 63075]|nr:HlyD family efflux transporter periplasmic adaptor subunit [Rhodobacteraceae bacterium 63075]